jgi:molecular chaperone HscC
MSGVAVGIDLGTTYSLAAVMRGDRPQVLPNALGELLTASAVAVDESGRVLVGAPARARAALDPDATALSFKRDMGTDRQRQLRDKSFRPEELSALVLAQVKRDAELALGEPIGEAVVTVPAYFGELQRRATRDACEIAELHVERIVNEPTAAALAYGLHNRQREMRAVVLDLGGGTFDVTVLEIMEGVIEIQASAGDTRLGGEDFVEALALALAARIEREHRLDEGALRARGSSWARLVEGCELLKQRLSRDESSALVLPRFDVARGRSVDVELALSRQEAEVLWTPLVERIRGPIHRALADADVAPQKLDEVLLVGGATRMPCVATLAAGIFGRLPLRTLPPDEAVALGAAVQAGLKSGHAAVEDLVVTDVAPFTLGIATAQRVGGTHVSGIFTPILERGTVLPASRVERVATIGDGQKVLMVEVYQGEHSLCSDNTKLGEYKLTGIPPAAAGEQEIDVRFTYDLNGILEVDSVIVSTRKSASLVIERSPGRLSAADVKAARAAMKRLKFHPREALPNVTALARADALFAELIGIEREMLGSAIGSLRAALETQDPKHIESTRAALQRLTEDLARQRR